MSGAFIPSKPSRSSPRWTSDIGRLYWIPILSSGVQHLLGLRICGCNIIVSKSALAVGGENLKEMVGKLSLMPMNKKGLSSDLAVQRTMGIATQSCFTKWLTGDETGISSNYWRMKGVWCWTIPRASQRRYYFIYSSPPGESWRVEGIRCGPDGFTIAVFQDCWDVIKDDLVRVFAEFHNSGIINQNTNASFIVLLPKKSQSKKISDFRPISLITCLYKVIAKVLLGRLRGVLQETIHSTQGAFVKGRQILDAVLIANEIVDEKRRSWEEGVVFKIDFEKAYDHVKWDFLDRVLKKKGFSPKWRKWMSGCLSSVSYAILVNGNAKGWVKASRGLRQGDPLSSFLFTIVADVLSRMLLKAEERSLLEGFRVVFDQVSGLKVNLDKSNLFGINLDQNHLSRRLDGWQKAYLSFGGRIILLHSCLSHILSYFLSLFKIPTSVVAKVERMQMNFLWSGVGEGKRDHLVSWDVCVSEGKRGFGDWEDSFKESRSFREMVVEVVTSLSLEDHCTSLSGFFQVYLVGRRKWGKNSLLGRFMVGDQIFKDQYPRLFRVVMDKSVPIYSILGSARPFSWNFNFRRNLTDYEIEDLERLMRSIDCMTLSTFASDARSWFLLPSGLFTVKSFFTALSQTPDSSPLFPSKFVWKSQVPFKVKAFVCLVAHKKVNTNDLLQLRRPHKALSPDISSQDGMGPSKSISDMMFINYKGFGKSKRGLVLWQNACIALIWVVWRERNARIFEDKARNSENLWDSIHFIASFWAFCSAVLRAFPLTFYN
ncbi:Transposon TX1 uncharacterized 149 kDa protein [Vitis vinifera]|uniref:Transposon TX1 uncharacterized 149 kDa protein n=1 Tax=Vitis vinifera TaxID=29760 RepID=A0A438GB83_VITVI|nr:Transposon TX1 uncharacterized 149 kDa protein [Vitis vinifera]